MSDKKAYEKSFHGKRAMSYQIFYYNIFISNFRDGIILSKKKKNSSLENFIHII